MNEQNSEAFNVEVQSTRPDGYRRGGFSLSRGINHLANVPAASLILLRRDPSVAVLDYVPVGMGAEENRSALFSPVPSPFANAGAQQLGAGELNPPSGGGLVEPTLAELLAAHIPVLTPEQYTAGGLPDLKALAELAGRPVTAAERDEAFAVFEAQVAAAAENTEQK